MIKFFLYFLLKDKRTLMFCSNQRFASDFMNSILKVIHFALQRLQICAIKSMMGVIFKISQKKLRQVIDCSFVFNANCARLFGRIQQHAIISSFCSGVFCVALMIVILKVWVFYKHERKLCVSQPSTNGPLVLFLLAEFLECQQVHLCRRFFFCLQLNFACRIQNIPEICSIRSSS